MIRFVVGKTGGGKSQFLVSKLIDELRSSRRGIVTSLAIELGPWVNKKGVAYPGLLKTLEMVYGDTFDAVRRIYVLKDEEIAYFWRVRVRVPEDADLPREVITVAAAARDQDGRSRWFQGPDVPGCWYAIGEAHEHFSAETWKNLVGEGQSWASQNRRGGDDAWIETQDAELVAKPLRRQSLECYTMINHAYRALGPFRQPDVISYRIHVNTPPRESEPCLRMGRIDLPREKLWGCYDTARGGSVHGGSADIGKRAAGINWKAIPALLVGFFIVACVGLVGCEALVKRAISGPDFQKLKGAASFRMTNLVAPVAEAPAAAVRKVVVVPQSSINTNIVVAWGGVPGRGYTVQFEDGSEVDAVAVVAVGGNVLVDGVQYRHRRHRIVDQSSKKF